VGTRLMLGDCLIRLKELPDNSVDSIVTDPPYGLSFMGKKWDYDVPSVEIWQQCLRVLKPGGHLLAFAGTRTQHRMAVRIEDAGFEIRDMIAWVYGSGFPKSLDVSKAIDKMAGAEREVVGVRTDGNKGGGAKTYDDDAYVWDKPFNVTVPSTEAAKQWQGWGTALKPSLEPITVARKPLIGTVADNVLQHGTGGINIDGCRVAYNGEQPSGWFNESERKNAGFKLTKGSSSKITSTPNTGRWPANFIHDGSEEVVGLFPDTGISAGGYRGSGKRDGWGMKSDDTKTPIGFGDSGSAARFFYCAKASKKDRGQGNNHPTVKPTALMQYLCRLVTPSKGTVLDPFMGSGSTAVACVREKFNFIGVEMLREHFETAKNRIVTERKAQS
jgi:DNA modification methylase